MRTIIVAVDGFSSCGKSTMARDLARAVGYAYIDTGAMYRAVTLYAIHQGFFHGDTLNEAALQQAMDNIEISFRPNPETGVSETFLNGEPVEAEIRGMEVSNRVSRIATLGFVRRALVSKQQAMGEAKGIVMDGRDIGTVVFPQAELKIFVTASAEIRAQRRVKEMSEKGESVSFDEVLNNVQERDRLDMTRAESPLRKADDAIELDNTHMTIAEQQAWLMNEFRKATEK
ncbi:MAG: (d)CMP kinase [Tannerella sp.]|uniref:(d)CMP kinase n=1 Tax=Tannerella sp. TaxID=2382127 RepID=UPI003FA30B25